MADEEKRRGRPAKNMLRITLSLDKRDTLTTLLIEEAKARGVSVPEHVRDLLKARYLSGTIPPYTPHRQDKDK